VLAVLERAKRYPLLAQRRGLEGTVEIAFLISSDGTISDPQVIVPSPHRVLDEATLAMVHRIGSLPPPPDRIPLRFPVSIQYKLESIASPISTEGAHP
jgi:protein TonB